MLRSFRRQNTAHDVSCPCASQEQQHEFDIVGHPRAGFSFVVVFPFHPSADGGPGGEVRLIAAPPLALPPRAELSAFTSLVSWHATRSVILLNSSHATEQQ